MIKALFFDIDGTIANNKGEVLPSTKEALKEAKEKGILRGIATGRSPFRMDTLLSNVTLDVYVTYNGQLVLTGEGEVLFENPFSKEVVEKLALYGETHDKQMLFGSRTALEGSNLMMFGQSNRAKKIYRLLPRRLRSLRLKNLIGKLQINKKKPNYTNLAIMKEPIYQCIMLCSEEETPAIQRLFPECHFTRSNPFSVDIVPKGGSKILGIMETANHYGIEKEEIMAFGDSWNDHEMLSGVGYGIAMGNANEDIKKIARDVTDTNNQDGIYKALVKYQVITGRENN